jgi:hypothetical protein
LPGETYRVARRICYSRLAVASQIQSRGCGSRVNDRLYRRRPVSLYLRRDERMSEEI